MKDTSMISHSSDKNAVRTRGYKLSREAHKNPEFWKNGNNLAFYVFDVFILEDGELKFVERYVAKKYKEAIERIQKRLGTNISIHDLGMYIIPSKVLKEWHSNLYSGGNGYFDLKKCFKLADRLFIDLDDKEVKAGNRQVKSEGLRQKLVWLIDYFKRLDIDVDVWETNAGYHVYVWFEDPSALINSINNGERAKKDLQYASDTDLKIYSAQIVKALEGYLKYHIGEYLDKITVMHAGWVEGIKHAHKAVASKRVERIQMNEHTADGINERVIELNPKPVQVRYLRERVFKLLNRKAQNYVHLLYERGRAAASVWSDNNPYYDVIPSTQSIVEHPKGYFREAQEEEFDKNYLDLVYSYNIANGYSNDINEICDSIVSKFDPIQCSTDIELLQANAKCTLALLKRGLEHTEAYDLYCQLSSRKINYKTFCSHYAYWKRVAAEELGGKRVIRRASRAKPREERKYTHFYERIPDLSKFFNEHSERIDYSMNKTGNCLGIRRSIIHDIVKRLHPHALRKEEIYSFYTRHRETKKNINSYIVFWYIRDYPNEARMELSRSNNCLSSQIPHREVDAANSLLWNGGKLNREVKYYTITEHIEGLNSAFSLAASKIKKKIQEINYETGEIVGNKKKGLFNINEGKLYRDYLDKMMMSNVYMNSVYSRGFEQEKIDDNLLNILGYEIKRKRLYKKREAKVSQSVTEWYKTLQDGYKVYVDYDTSGIQKGREAIIEEAREHFLNGEYDKGVSLFYRIRQFNDKELSSSKYNQYLGLEFEFAVFEDYINNERRVIKCMFGNGLYYKVPLSEIDNILRLIGLDTLQKTQVNYEKYYDEYKSYAFWELPNHTENFFTINNTYDIKDLLEKYAIVLDILQYLREKRETIREFDSFIDDIMIRLNLDNLSVVKSLLDVYKNELKFVIMNHKVTEMDSYEFRTILLYYSQHRRTFREYVRRRLYDPLHRRMKKLRAGIEEHELGAKLDRIMGDLLSQKELDKIISVLSCNIDLVAELV